MFTPVVFKLGRELKPSYAGTSERVIATDRCAIFRCGWGGLAVLGFETA
jgi:hypothetical protein